MKKLLYGTALFALLLGLAGVVNATGHSTIQGQADRLIQKYHWPLSDNSGPYGDEAFKKHFQNNSPAYSIVMDEGAIKGYSAWQIDGTAHSDTAGEFNILHLGAERLIHSPNVSVATSLPVMAATGLDLTNGNTQDNDVDELVGGILGASGRPFVVGTDPAFKFCAHVNLADVSASDLMVMGFRTPNSTRTAGSVPYATAIGTYTDYAGIGLLSGAVTTWTGSNGTDVVTDLASITDVVDSAGIGIYCTFVSAAGVVTYTYNGSSSTDAVAYTFADGFHVVPFLWYQQNTDSDGASDPLVNAWYVDFQ